MANSSISKTIGRCASTFPTHSKLKTYGFAIAIIVGIGGLAVGAAGLAGYFHVGALSNMAQIHAIIMMAAGGGVGTILLIIGAVGTASGSTELEEIIKSINTENGSVYGPKVWKLWKVEVLDDVPPIPQVNLRNTNQVLLYIPKRLRFNNKVQDFNLQALKEIRGTLLQVPTFIEQQCGNNTAHGWVLIDGRMLLDNISRNYNTCKKDVEAKHGNMPSVLEAVLINLMVSTFTKVMSWRTATYCIETVNNAHPFVVVDSESVWDDNPNRSISVFLAGTNVYSTIGAYCVLRNF